jgi:hypothetical protein
MKPFRYAYLLFNPAFIVSATKEQVKRRGKDELYVTDFYVTITTTVGPTIRIRTIDELEQEGTLQEFFNAWKAAAL